MYIPTAPKNIRRAVRRGFIAGFRGQPKNTVSRHHYLRWWFYMGWLDGSRLSSYLTVCGARYHLLKTT